MSERHWDWMGTSENVLPSPSLCSHCGCLWRNAGVLDPLPEEAPGRSGAGAFGSFVREMSGRALGVAL